MTTDKGKPDGWECTRCGAIWRGVEECASLAEASSWYSDGETYQHRCSVELDLKPAKPWYSEPRNYGGPDELLKGLDEAETEPLAGKGGPLWYMAAPVSPAEGETLAGNLEHARGYWRALLLLGLQVEAPWVGLCAALQDTDAEERRIGMAVDLEVLRRCDGIVLCGPRASQGMLGELLLAKRLGLDRWSLVGLSPDDYQQAFGQLLEARAERPHIIHACPTCGQRQAHGRVV